MKRTAYIALVISSFAAATYYLCTEHPVYPFCPFKRITGIACPGCGGIRATQALLHGEILYALWINPLAIAVDIFLFVAAIWSIVDIIRRKSTLLPLLKRPWKKSMTIIVFAIIIANWIWSISKGL